MAKINVSGNVVTVISEITKDQIELLKKYNSEALSLKDKDGNVTFAIDFVPSASCGSVNKYGITFDSHTFGDKKICVSVKAKKHYDSAKDFVVEEIGMAVVKLNEIEKAVVPSVEEITAQLEAVIETINVAE